MKQKADKHAEIKKLLESHPGYKVYIHNQRVRVFYSSGAGCVAEDWDYLYRLARGYKHNPWKKNLKFYSNRSNRRQTRRLLKLEQFDKIPQNHRVDPGDPWDWD